MGLCDSSRMTEKMSACVEEGSSGIVAAQE